MCEVIKSICEFSHQLSETIVLGFATSHTASIEAGAGMLLCFLKHHNNIIEGYCKNTLGLFC